MLRCLRLRKFSSLQDAKISAEWDIARVSSVIRSFRGSRGEKALLSNFCTPPRVATREHFSSKRLTKDIAELDVHLMENGILLEDVLRLNDEDLGDFSNFTELRSSLYGCNPYPFVKRSDTNLDCRATWLRRQLLIEQIVSSQVALEYRILTEGLAGRGQLHSLPDPTIKKIWRSWTMALAKRVEEELTPPKDAPTKSGLSFRFTTAARTATKLLSSCGLSPEKIAAITLVTSTSEICNPDSTRSSVTGRGSGTVDFDVFAASVREWTNLDIESSISDAGDVGRVVSAQLCDAIGTAVQYTANFERGRKKVALNWSQEERLILGSELIRWMVSECMIPMHHDAALRELEIGQPSQSARQVGGKWLIDPEADLYSFLRPPIAEIRGLPIFSENGPESRVLVNAFKHSIESRGFKSTGYISLNPSMVEMFSKVIPRNSFFRLPPMVVPPAPWGTFWECGYITRRFPFVRFTGTKDSARDFKLHDFTKAKECMDYLGSTKWVVNRKVLDLIETALLISDREIPGLPKFHSNKQAPKSTQADRAKLKSSSKVEKRTELMRQLKEKQKLECEEPILLSKLDVARNFKDAPELYFPHSIDFRGRAYPIPAPFNHQGDDLTRSLLKFGDKRKLGERGWFWLRVHCANLFGKDKLAFAERIEWTNHNMGKLLQVAEDPLSEDSVKFVSSLTDDFWQAVAACMEISEAVKTCGPNPFEYESSLPVQQDGSCNGLQHYAALGRDKLGALAVNVSPSSKVEDVYSVVLDLVKERVKEDALKYRQLSMDDLLRKCPSRFSDLKAINNEEARSLLAQVALGSEGVLARKTVKQTVMTICYGVTQIGASDQVAKQLNDLPISKKLNGAQLAVLSSYLARLTLSSIDTVFCKAMEIKRWFDQVAAEFNKHKIPVCWISPAGIPCRQPYRQQKSTEIRTPLQKINVVSEKSMEEAKVSGPKQRMGFPPNFIHSLDASHMMLTALECKKLGIVFASVHDSYWTHASDVDAMNRVLRQEFYNMYQQPILENLRSSFVLSLGADGKNIPPLPAQGELDLICVIDSPYFFD
jgi:hypothetical protein